jgi:hypothetical protein
MPKRTSRRVIRDKLDRAAAATRRAEGILAECIAAYYERGTSEGAMLEQLRVGLEMQAQCIADFRQQRS